jgi:hypothetical protein
MEKRFVDLKHTFRKGLPFTMEVVIRLDIEKKRYILQLNGCEETGWIEGIPNIEEETK